MEIIQEHRDFLNANIGNYESAKNGYIRNLELNDLKMYEHIYRLYLDPNFIVSVWCGSCKFDMIMRLYKWYEQKNEQETINTFFFKQEELKEVKTIEEQFEILKFKKRKRNG
jgi:hypothetical protein